MKLSSEILNTPSLEFSALARSLNSKGKKIISLGLGEPDIDTPQNIKNSTIKALKNGFTKYSNSNGLFDLRKSLTKKLKIENNIITKPENIIITSGSKQACAFALMALLEPKDEVICINPSYVSYIPQIKIAEPRSKIRIVNLDKDFNLNFEDLNKNINKKTKVIIINSPNNPTGKIFSKTDFLKLYKLIAKKNIFIISDEIYEKLILKNNHFSPASIKKMSKKIITINGFSKTFAMTGWRIGYLVANDDIIKKITSLSMHINTNVNTFIQKGLIDAYNLNKNFIENFKNKLINKSKYLDSVVNKKHCYNLILPEGGFFAFLNIEKTKLSSDKFSYYLLSKYNVAVTPGIIFGKNWDNYIRISMSTNTKEFKDGIKLLCKYLDEF